MRKWKPPSRAVLNQMRAEEIRSGCESGAHRLGDHKQDDEGEYRACMHECGHSERSQTDPVTGSVTKPQLRTPGPDQGAGIETRWARINHPTA